MPDPIATFIVTFIDRATTLDFIVVGTFSVFMLYIFAFYTISIIDIRADRAALKKTNETIKANIEKASMVAVKDALTKCGLIDPAKPAPGYTPAYVQDLTARPTPRPAPHSGAGSASPQTFGSAYSTLPAPDSAKTPADILLAAKIKMKNAELKFSPAMIAVKAAGGHIVEKGKSRFAVIAGGKEDHGARNLDDAGGEGGGSQGVNTRRVTALTIDEANQQISDRKAEISAREPGAHESAVTRARRAGLRVENGGKNSTFPGVFTISNPKENNPAL